MKLCVNAGSGFETADVLLSGDIFEPRIGGVRSQFREAALWAPPVGVRFGAGDLELR